MSDEERLADYKFLRDYHASRAFGEIKMCRELPQTALERSMIAAECAKRAVRYAWAIIPLESLLARMKARELGE